MSEATSSIKALREYRSRLKRRGRDDGATWVTRCIAVLQRQLGDRQDVLTELEIDTARTPLDESDDRVR